MQYEVTECRVMTPKEATKKGYKSITIPYHLKTNVDEVFAIEFDLWRKVIRTMQGTNFVAVEFPDGFEIWRHKSELTRKLYIKKYEPSTGTK